MLLLFNVKWRIDNNKQQHEIIKHNQSLLSIYVWHLYMCVSVWYDLYVVQTVSFVLFDYFLLHVFFCLFGRAGTVCISYFEEAMQNIIISSISVWAMSVEWWLWVGTWKIHLYFMRMHVSVTHAGPVAGFCARCAITCSLKYEDAYNIYFLWMKLK